MNKDSTFQLNVSIKANNIIDIQKELKSIIDTLSFQKPSQGTCYKCYSSVETTIETPIWNKKQY